MTIKPFIKRFAAWISLKEKLHNVQNTPPLVKERDVWWASVGENVGSEMNGKSALFSRPVVILKKLSRGFYFVAPTTTQVKAGTWYVEIRHKDVIMHVCLHQVRTIDHRRLSTRIGKLDSNDFTRVKKAFIALYG